MLSVDWSPSVFVFVALLGALWNRYVDWVVPLSRVVQRVTEFHVQILHRPSGRLVGHVVVDNPSKPRSRFTASNAAGRQRQRERKNRRPVSWLYQPMVAGEACFCRELWGGGACRSLSDSRCVRRR